MSSFLDTTLAPFRRFFGPVFDEYRKKYEYTHTEKIEGHLVSTIEGVPLPDVASSRRHNFYYSVFGPPDQPVKADIVGMPVTVKMQSKPVPRTYGRGEIVRPVEWLPEDVPMHETFVDMPFTQKTEYRSSTVATRHS